VAGLRGVPVSDALVTAVTGLPDAPAVLQSLRDRGLLQAHSPTYTVAGNLAGVAGLEATPAPPAVTAFLLAETDPATLAGAAQIGESVMAAAAAAGRWPEVLRLARHLEDPSVVRFGSLPAAGSRDLSSILFPQQ